MPHSLLQSNVAKWILSRRYQLSLAALLILGVVLRFYRISAQSLWYDETTSVERARLDLIHLIVGLRSGVHSPFYFVVLKIWMAIFGSSATSVRGLSAVAGVAGIGALYLLGKDLFGRKAGIIAASILTISPFHIAFSQETRMYALLFLFSVLSMHAFWLAFVSRRSGWSLAYYVSSSIILVYLHFNGIFVLVAQAVYVVVRWLRSGAVRQELKRISAAGVLLLVLYLPLAFLTVKQVHHRLVEGWWVSQPTMGSLRDTYLLFAGDYLRRSWGLLGGPVILGGLFGLLCVNAVVPSDLDGLNVRQDAETKGERHPAAELALLGGWAASVVLLPFAVSQVTTPIYLDRTLISALAPLALLTAFGVSRLRSTYLKAILIVLIVAATIGQVRHQYRLQSKEDWRDAISFLEAHATRDSLVVFSREWLSPPWSYYNHRDDLEVLWPSSPYSESFQRIGKQVQGEKEVWLVLAPRQFISDPDVEESLVQRISLSLGSPREAQQFVGVRVMRFKR